MISHLVRRSAAALVLVAIVLTLLFFVVRLAPGDPSAFYDVERLPPEQRRALTAALGLDRPMPLQYLLWIGATARGNLGFSFTHSRPVSAVLADHLPPTLALAGVALVLQYGLAILLGVAAARRAGRLGDHLIRVLSLFVYAVPQFWLGLMALLLLSYRLPIFPGGQMRSVGAEELAEGGRLLDFLAHLALPALVLGLGSCGSLARYVRNAFLDVLESDFILAARARGLPERSVIWVHALRNSLTPLTQLAGLSLPFLFSGALVVEVVFSWPGMGRLTYDAIRLRDYPLILGATALTALLVVFGSLLADLLQGWVDPTVRDD